MESPPPLLSDSGPSRFGVTRPPPRWAPTIHNVVAGGEYGLRLWLQPFLFITLAAAFTCYSFDIIDTTNINVIHMEMQVHVPTTPVTTAAARQPRPLHAATWSTLVAPIRHISNISTHDTIVNNDMEPPVEQPVAAMATFSAEAAWAQVPTATATSACALAASTALPAALAAAPPTCAHAASVTSSTTYVNEAMSSAVLATAPPASASAASATILAVLATAPSAIGRVASAWQWLRTGSIGVASCHANPTPDRPEWRCVHARPTPHNLLARACPQSRALTRKPAKVMP